MDRRLFLTAAGVATLAATLKDVSFGQATEPPSTHRLPDSDVDYQRSKSYVEEVPVRQYHWASDRAVEAFKDMKFGLRIHWGIYSILEHGNESWPFLKMSYAERQSYNQLYKTWNPKEFDANGWMNLCNDAGMKMFAFTTKHHEGFSMWDTRTRIRQRANWTATGGPKIEDCDLAYSIMESPFRRDVVQELTAAAHKRGVKIDLYFSNPDWYDADFRPYGWHPLQVPSSPELWGWRPADGPVEKFWDQLKQRFANQLVIVPDPTPTQVSRMVQRHRTQLTELMTKYGTIDMLDLDIFWGPRVWPQLRETILKVRELQPDIMMRARGIGNYGDYYTPERFVPSSKTSTAMPWFVIYPLGSSFSYEADAAKYKGTEWMIDTLVDTVAKGGNFMVGVGPNGQGSFHPTAVQQLKETGKWLQVNGEGIYATRERAGALWSEGDLRFTRSKDERTLYCFATKWPGKTLSVKSLEEHQAGSVQMLGYPETLAAHWDAAAHDFTVTLPDALQEQANRPCKYAWCFKISSRATV